jgi:hypothetical protein
LSSLLACFVHFFHATAQVFNEHSLLKLPKMQYKLIDERKKEKK